MPFFVYILRCSDGSYYTGHTENLELRIAQHNEGTYESYTSERRPLALVWQESFASREEALEQERKLKGWSRAKKEALIAGDWGKVSELARKKR